MQTKPSEMLYVVELPPDYENDRVDWNYLFRRPETGELVTGEKLDNQHCHPPVHFEHAEAERLARELNALGPDSRWTIHVAPNPCPSCGREMWANDLDFCYADNRERTRYRAGCNVHDFGCGFELYAKTYEEAILAWNSNQLFNYKGRSYSRVEGKGKDALKAELQAVFDAYPEYNDPAHGLGTFEAMVDKFAQDEFYNLHFVAKHYLWLLSPKEA